MDAAEPVIVKAVSNDDYFGEPGVIRSILEAFVPYAVGQPDRDVLFIHRKDAAADISISVEIHAPATEQIQDLTQRTLVRLMDLPKLSFHVRFTEIVEATSVSFEAMIAPLEAESQLSRFFTGVNAKLAAEQYSRAVDTIDYTESMWDRLLGLPMPWEIRDNPELLAEANFIVDTLMGIVKEELD